MSIEKGREKGFRKSGNGRGISFSSLPKEKERKSQLERERVFCSQQIVDLI